MFCKNLVKKMNGKFKCKKAKIDISLCYCNCCSDFETKTVKPIKKRSKKQAKLERYRDKNIIKMGFCEACGEYSKRLDPHEVFGGCNRKRSILNNFVALICRKCHENPAKIEELKKKYQTEFEKTHTREEFIEIIGQSYL